MASDEQIKRATEMDLLTYLKSYESDNLIKICNGTYCTRDHDSLKISNGMWYWFSRNIGGHTALDYLMKVRGISFLQAVDIINGYLDIEPPVFVKAKNKPKSEKLELPRFNSNIGFVRNYLQQRGISNAIINYCHDNKLLFEDSKYHNCVFIGYDSDVPKYGAVRSIKSNYKGDLPGSDKRYSFGIKSEANSNRVHVFEAAIDLLSYATLEMKSYRNWRQDNLLSLAGVYKTNSKQDVPLALDTYLKEHCETNTIVLHLDNDDVGRCATKQIAAALSDRYSVIDMPPRSGKDYNDYLQNEIRKRKEMER